MDKSRCWAVSTCDRVDAGVASDGIILDPNDTLPCGLNLKGTCVCMPGRYPSSGCRRISVNSTAVETHSSHPHRYGVAGNYGTEMILSTSPGKDVTGRLDKKVQKLSKSWDPPFQGRSIPVYSAAGSTDLGAIFRAGVLF